MSDLLFTCPECGRANCQLKLQFYGKYATCDRNCYAVFKKMPIAFKACKWHPGLGKRAIDLLDEDKQIKWHCGCENEITGDALCTSCSDIAFEKKSGQPMKDAYETARLAKAKMILSWSKESIEVLTKANRAYREICGFGRRGQPRMRWKKAEKADSQNMSNLLVASNWEIYLLRHPEVQMTALELTAKLRSNQPPPME